MNVNANTTELPPPHIILRFKVGVVKSLAFQIVDMEREYRFKREELRAWRAEHAHVPWPRALVLSASDASIRLNNMKQQYDTILDEIAMLENIHGLRTPTPLE